MRTLKFLVKDKRITRQDGNTVVAGAVNHYVLELLFDEDWEGLTKTLVLQNGGTLVEQLYTPGLALPWEVCVEGGISLSVTGTKTLGDGRTQVVRTARMVKPIPVEPGGAETGDGTQGFTPDMAEQILAALGDLSALKTAQKDSIVAAVNEIYRAAGIESITFKQEDEAGNRVYTVRLSRGAEYDIVTPIGKTGQPGIPGENGTTFTPSVSETGVLSWTNDGGKENPEKVNIRGPEGKMGRGFRILGYYGTLAALMAAAANPEAGDAYGIGSEEPYDIYIWDGVNQTWVNNGALQGAPGENGEPGADGQPGADGTTFTPSVSTEGVLSWTNDGGKANPASVNIKGAKGDKGETGAAGANGTTPVKGVDYFTEADKAEIAEDAAELVDLSGKQDKITASGILKGDGAGGVSAAVAGTDYVSPANLTARLNRSSAVNAADTNYSTYMARGIALSAEEATPTANGAIVFQYE